MKNILLIILLNLLVLGPILSQTPVNKYRTIYPGINKVFDEINTPFRFNPDSLLPLDFNQNLHSKELSDLRILKASVYARNGQLLVESELRSYFAAKYKWYDSITTEVWLRIGDYVTAKPMLSDTEKKFVKEIDLVIAEKKLTNYDKETNMANIDNMVNVNEFKKLSSAFQKKLRENNFVLFQESYPQLFHIYEQNDYSEIPNFVTSDLYLQLIHMYFSYAMRSLEKYKFIQLITILTKELSMGAQKVSQTVRTPELRELAEFNQVYFSIPYQLLTGRTLPIPDKYKPLVNYEIQNIIEASDKESKLIPNFNFTLFKPRGHYTRSDSSKNYFRAMIWLQTVPFCRENKNSLKQAMLMSFILRRSSVEVKALFQSFTKTLTFLVGEPDNLSISDVTDVMKEFKITELLKIINDSVVDKVSSRLAEIVTNRNRIKPKIILTCPDKINFLPQRYVFDNEILQELVDVKINANRAFPRSLDVFAVLGNKTSEDILFNTYKDQKKWEDFSMNYKNIKFKFQNFKDWNKSVYNNWFQCLQALQTENKDMPPFMKTNAWARKILNTSLASYAELKHDAILYSEQPNAAEMGGGPMPPDPVVKGYVEPCKDFWEKAISLVKNTDSLFTVNKLLTNDLKEVSNSLLQQLNFMLMATNKELKNENLSNDDYNFIQKIGGHVDNLTLSILEPGKRPYDWYEVKSPDTCISLIADVYTRNVPYCPQNGILYQAVGPVHSIYVVVEMGGYLYLTKGAVFSHYEFVNKNINRLTDEEWQQQVVERKLPEPHPWMKDLILENKYAPIVDDTQQYYLNY